MIIGTISKEITLFPLNSCWNEHLTTPTEGPQIMNDVFVNHRHSIRVQDWDYSPRRYVFRHDLHPKQGMPVRGRGEREGFDRESPNAKYTGPTPEALWPI